MADRVTKGLFVNAKQHDEYAAKLNDLREKEASQKNSLENFVKILPKGELSSLEKRVIHLVVCENLLFSIVDRQPFKLILAVSDRESLRERHHYSDWDLPTMYEMVKAKIRELLKPCSSLSFTSDIWTEEMTQNSFISLTVRGIDQECKRFKYLLCVEPSSGSHNFETIGSKVEKMPKNFV